MSLYYVLIIFLLVCAAMWAVWKWVPQPPKIVLLWFLGIALVAWVLQIMGFWTWLRGVSI
jgi:hypothetical protein